MIKLRRLALCAVLSGLFVAFGEASSAGGSVSSDATIRGWPSPSQVESTSLPDVVPAPDTRRPSLANASEPAGPAAGTLDLETLSRVDADSALVARSLFEKYRAFRESLSTP